MVTGLAHLCFRVTDLERAVTFYTEVLGLSKAFEFVRENGERYGVYLKVGPRNFVELFETAEIVPGKGISYGHMCLEVDDMQETVVALRGQGVVVSEPKLGKDQSWQAWLADPEGNAIELHEYTAASRQGPYLT